MPRINKSDARRIRAAVHHFERTSRNKLPQLEKRVRMSGEETTTTSGGGDGGCPCEQIPEGTQTCLESNDTPAVYLVTGFTINGAAVFGEEIELAIDSACTYLSDDLSYSC